LRFCSFSFSFDFRILFRFVSFSKEYVVSDFQGYYSVGAGNLVCTQCPTGSSNGAPGQSTCILDYQRMFSISRFHRLLACLLVSLVLALQQSSLYGRIAGNGTTTPADGDRRTVGIVLVSIGSAIFVVGLLVLLIGGIFVAMKFQELTAIGNEIEKLKDLQNNRL
jgi:hypothetical protein